MRVRFPWTLLLPLCLVAGCDGTVVFISTGPSPFNGAQGVNGWNVIIHLTGGTALAQCAAVHVGQTTQYQLGVDRSADSVMLVLDPHNSPTDHSADYKGTLSASAVSATGHYYGRDLCTGTPPAGSAATDGIPASFHGLFSPDGRTLTGTETRTTTIGGRTYTYEYDWRAELKQP
jgi:hypothetical protein